MEVKMDLNLVADCDVGYVTLGYVRIIANYMLILKSYLKRVRFYYIYF